MSRPLRVLIVEDSEQDARLLILALRRLDFEPEYRRVETGQAMRDSLDEGTWDIIFSDHSMPAFDAMRALAIYREKGLDIPFIIVSGAIGEEVAVAAMRSGAHDYLLKDRMDRLGAAVERELEQAKVRQVARDAEAEKQRLHAALEAEHDTLLGRHRELRALNQMFQQALKEGSDLGDAYREIVESLVTEQRSLAQLTSLANQNQWSRAMDVGEQMRKHLAAIIEKAQDQPQYDVPPGRGDDDPVL